MAKQTSNLIYDGCQDFALGMDSGSNVASLPKNQFAFGINTSCRGDYITHRQSVRKLPIDPVLNSKIQGAFGSGLFQGAVSFKADTNPESLVLAIAGRYFELFPSNDSSTNCTGSEITIPSDPNPASKPQAFMWQSESWLIINDGLSTPIFYDGTSSRRSQTTVSSVGVVDSDFVVPPINGTVDVTLTAPYAGLLNAVLNLEEVDGSTPPNVLKVANYIVTKVGGNIAQYQAVLKNLSDTAGTTYSNNTQLIVQPANLGNITSVSGSNPNYTVGISSAFPAYVSVGQTMLINSIGYTIMTIATNRLTATVKLQGGGSSSPAVGNNAVLQNNNSPNVVVGLVESSFVSPAIGSNVTVYLQSQFTQSNGLVLFIGTGQYQVISSQTNPPAADTAITVQNINDTPSNDPSTGLPLPVKAKSTFYNLSELPPARMGTYGQGRNWQSGIDGVTFIGGDIVGGASGSSAYNDRDAVLKFTENTNTFNVPGSGEIITGMSFAATLDASLGQGPLQVFTNKNVFSCQAPADSSTWASLTTPVLTESLKGGGAAGQDSITNINSDIVFRSPDGQIRSQILARKDFNTWTNTPISHEMERVLRSENLDLMNFSSAIEFDNRRLETCNPIQVNNGVYWQGVMSFNLDPLSTIYKKTNPIWEGSWVGLNVLKLVRFTNVERAFALCVNLQTGALELYEIQAEGDSYFDNGTIPIPWSFETPMFFHNIKEKNVFDLCKLEDGEMYVSDVQGKVSFTVEYRADYDSCWHPWHSWTVCAGQGNDQTSEYPQYRRRMGFGQVEIDPDDCNVNTEEPPMYGTMFQSRVTVVGHCTINRIREGASLQPQPKFSEPICNIETQAAATVPGGLFYNQTVYSNAICSGSEIPSLTGSLPTWITLDIPNNRLVGSSDVINGNTQDEANTNAQTILNQFLTNNLENGNLVCSGLVGPEWTQLDWASLSVNNPLFVTHSGDGTASFNPASGLNDTFTSAVSTTDLGSGGANSAYAFNEATLDYNGSSVIANFHLVITGTGHLQGDFQINAFTNDSWLNWTLNPRGLAEGTYDFQFIIPDTGGVSKTIHISTFNTFDLTNSGLALSCQIVGTLSTIGAYVAPSLDNSNVSKYEVESYFDGLITNATGNVPSFYSPAISTIWDGKFTIKDDGTIWVGDWTAAPADAGGNENILLVNGKCASCISVYFDTGGTNKWAVYISDDNSNVLWSGLKAYGTTVNGTYLRDGGSNNLAALTIVAISGNATVEPASC